MILSDVTSLVLESDNRRLANERSEALEKAEYANNLSTKICNIVLNDQEKQVECYQKLIGSAAIPFTIKLDVFKVITDMRLTSFVCCDYLDFFAI